MKNSLFLFLLLLSSIVLAQHNNQLTEIKPPQKLTDPTFIVDTIVVDKNSLFIYVNEIESISVLKENEETLPPKTSIGATVLVKIKENSKLVLHPLMLYPKISSEAPVFIVDGNLIDDTIALAVSDIDIACILLNFNLYGENKKTDELSIELDPERWAIPDFTSRFKDFAVAEKTTVGSLDEATLKKCNAIYANEWNKRYNNPAQWLPSTYCLYIDYDAEKDYGYDVNYQLYLFFKFMEKEKGMSLDVQ